MCELIIVLHTLLVFSSSEMFATHVRGRIDDMSMTARDRSSIMPRELFLVSRVYPPDLILLCACSDVTS